MNHARVRVLLLLVCTAVAILLAVNSPLLAGGSGNKGRPAKAPPQDPSQYVGSEACAACHEDIAKKFDTTPHYKTTLDTRGGPAKQGCEACHGPGAEHVAGGGDKSKIILFSELRTRQITENCQSCHQYGQEHSNFSRSAHANNDVSCIGCHSIHKPKEKQFLLVKAQPDLCYSCHNDIKPQFSRPFRHRVNEKLVKCTDCHNQHGGFLTAGQRATNAQDTTCFKCHVEKAGPFVFEHAPVKTEGCVACHVPHGSTSPRMLKRTQINLLCLECHTLSSDIASPPPAGPPHNQTQKYQACTVCHVTVHGSNHSAVFFR
jgi:DmsE family decaheme c-type cytochrome